MEWGEEFTEMQAYHVLRKLFVLPGGNTVVLTERNVGASRPRPGSWQLTAFDKALKMVHNKPLVFSGDPDGERDLVRMTNWNGQLFVFSEHKGGRKDPHTFYVERFDPNTMESMGDARKLAEVDQEFLQGKPLTVRVLTWAPDSATFMLYYTLRSKNVRQKVVGFKLFDEDFNLLGEDTYELVYSDMQPLVKDWKLDAQGHAYLLISLTNVKVWQTDKERGLGLRLLRSHLPSKTHEGCAVELDKRYILDADLSFLPDGRPLCWGIYGQDSQWSPDGAFSMVWDGSLEETPTVSVESIPKVGSAGSIGKKHGVKNHQKELEASESISYWFRDLHWLEDGTAIGLAEARWLYQRSQQWVRIYDDLHVLKLQADGQFVWIKNVAKTQAPRQIGFSMDPYGALVHQDMVHVFFNVSVDDMEEEIANTGWTDYVDDKWELPFYRVSLNGDGAQGFALKLPYHAHGLLMRPGLAAPFPGGRVVMLGLRAEQPLARGFSQKAFKLGLLTVPDL